MSIFIVEIQNDFQDWIRKSYHRGEDNASIMYEIQVEAGRRCRIVHDGKVIQESEE